mmetsp:Transcript_10319/g.18952  ORF Transcript_10319/g.18952 Transcript_10319/m.18952 type:complete len:232 (-) Transcript_10319:1359-2054(-)
MSILTHDEWSCFIHTFRRIVRPFHHLINRWVHRTYDIRTKCRILPVVNMRELTPNGPVGTLVLNKPRTIITLDPTIQHGLVHRIPGFVPQAPADYARVVLIPNHHSLHPVQHGRRVRMIAADHVVMPVAFDIGFIHDVQAEFVRKVVKVWIIRIVRRANGIKVVFLHQHQVFPDFFEGHRLAPDLAVIVTVHALHENRLAVDEELPVPDFHGSESNFEVEDVHFVCWVGKR